MKLVSIPEGDAAEVLSLLLIAEQAFDERASFAATIDEADHFRVLSTRTMHARLALGKAGK